jgi:alpha-ketoglutarate-dependent taurine dioxygenase
VTSDLAEAQYGSAPTASSIAEIDNAASGPLEADAVSAVLAEHFGAEAGGDSLAPPADSVPLRAALRAAAPRMSALSDEVRARFDDGACGILVRNLGISALDVDLQRKAIYGFSVLLGDVRWTHPIDDRVVWDVKRAETVDAGPARYSSFSENDREAEYHTDASFAAFPDRYFLLHSVQQAEGEGGETFLTDARNLRAELERTPEGREAVRVLSENDFPMRVPKAFRKEGDASPDGYLYSPIIAGGSIWRFRKDKIEKGLEAKPDHATPEVRQALDLLYQQLEGRTDEFRAAIPTDGVLIVDNHVALHGRTAFADPGRHLLRARFHKAASYS